MDNIEITTEDSVTIKMSRKDFRAFAMFCDQIYGREIEDVMNRADASDKKKARVTAVIIEVMNAG
jgi:NADH/NAD ratio-sensing transcriptional regulator Rex